MHDLLSRRQPGALSIILVIDIGHRAAAGAAALAARQQTKNTGHEWRSSMTNRRSLLQATACETSPANSVAAAASHDLIHPGAQRYLRAAGFLR